MSLPATDGLQPPTDRSISRVRPSVVELFKQIVGHLKNKNNNPIHFRSSAFPFTATVRVKWKRRHRGFFFNVAWTRFQNDEPTFRPATCSIVSEWRIARFTTRRFIGSTDGGSVRTVTDECVKKQQRTTVSFFFVDFSFQFCWLYGGNDSARNRWRVAVRLASSSNLTNGINRQMQHTQASKVPFNCRFINDIPLRQMAGRWPTSKK